MKGYSIEKYMRDSIFEESAAKIHINKENSPHDFFYVNDPAHFEYFKNLGYNAILQSQEPEDDGSLSVYCAQKKIPYINVEAMEGHFEEQLKMLEELQKLLGRR
jgi:aspartate-semialdehyde dehydrogenase